MYERVQRSSTMVPGAAARRTVMPSRRAQHPLAHSIERMTEQNAEPMQRKVGFEFESAADPSWRFQGRDDADEDWTPINHTKAMLVPLASGLGGISADNGKVEMRTEPLTTWTEVNATIDGLTGMVDAYAARATELAGGINLAAKAHTNKNFNRVVGRNDLMPAKPQATLGVAMANMNDLFDEFQRLGRTATSGSLQEDFANPTVLYQMSISATAAQDILSDAADVYRASIRNPDYQFEDVASLEGLLTIIIKTIYDAYSNSGRDLTDPKYAFPLMARTDFTSMVGSMPAVARADIMKLWECGGLLAAFGRQKLPVEEHMFPGGYTMANRKRSKGPTIGAFLTSIFTGDDPKDLLSPPPGYPRHGLNPEGIGAYGADRTEPNLALFELRNLTNGKVIAANQWKPVARLVSALAATTQSDDRLRPT
jgi:hypothetical protein